MTGATLTFLAFDANTSVCCFRELKEDARWTNGKIANAFLATWQWTKNQLRLPNLATTYSFAWEEPHPINPSPPMERDLIFTLYSSSVEADSRPINRPIGHFHAFHVPSILPFNQVSETPSGLELNPLFHMIWLPQDLFLQSHFPQILSCQFSTALVLVIVLLACTIHRQVCLHWQQQKLQNKTGSVGKREISAWLVAVSTCAITLDGRHSMGDELSRRRGQGGNLNSITVFSPALLLCPFTLL